MPISTPTFIPPQLARAATMVPTGPGWLFEEKFDGYRAQIRLAPRDVRVLTRNGHDWTGRFAGLTAALAALALGRVVLDGEICAVDDAGRSDFTTLCRNIRTVGYPLKIVAFDLLESEGQSLLGEPLSERKRHLAGLLKDARSPALQAAPFQMDNGQSLLDRMRRLRREGIIAKRIDSPYRPGERNSDWLKIKLQHREEFVIAGWHAEGGAVRSIILADFDQGALVYRGRVGTGFSVQERRTLHQRLLQLEQSRSPFCKAPKGLGPTARWLTPMLLAQVEYAEISPNGSVRCPSFLGLRDDRSVDDLRITASV
ncbi:MAG: non-homologous end-joining DNA ligase [Devosia sp.]|nr:non-homologous end-joining DNA ligase [Devosia sp.]